MGRLLEEVDLRVDRDADVPLGAQLVAALRDLIDEGRLRPGDRLPSIRELALAAGVNVNTVRAVYARLDREGHTVTEHGRGTFVAGEQAATGRRSEQETRQELRREIARLERELVRTPTSPALKPRGPAPRAGGLLTTEELQAVHDELLERLWAIDAERAQVVQRISELEQLGEIERLDEADQQEEERLAARRSSPSLSGARVRWVG